MGNKCVVAIAIAVMLIASGCCYIGQVHHQLVEANMEITDLKEQVSNRNIELQALIQELERIQQRPEQPRYFTSLEEFETWLAQDNTDKRHYFADDFNCLDFALMLQERALRDGYIISLESPPIANHWLNSVYINGSIYLVEPQRDEIVLVREVG